jgi:hypothetical protein
MNVYQCIAAVTKALSKTGISKDRKNSQQGNGYMFRGIDDVYAALSPLLAEHQLCVLPRVLERTVTEQTSKSGGLLFYTVLKVEFDFVSAEDGSKHTVCTVGEAMDSGDKSSNKAMSAAYKYACFQAFCIPTEGDNDADSSTHELKTKPHMDTKKVNAETQRLMKAVDESKDTLVREIVGELRAVTEEFWMAVWRGLPKSHKDYINDHMKEAA